MSETSDEVLLDDFENRENWELAGPGADRTHLTTFAEGAPSKRPGIYADGGRGADHRALVLLIRSAVSDFEVELRSRAGREFVIPGRCAGVNLWMRTPHAALRAWAILRDDTGEVHDLPLGELPVDSEWQRFESPLSAPLTDPLLLGLRVRLGAVVQRAGEVMVLLDDLTATVER